MLHGLLRMQPQSSFLIHLSGDRLQQLPAEAAGRWGKEGRAGTAVMDGMDHVSGGAHLMQIPTKLLGVQLGQLEDSATHHLPKLSGAIFDSLAIRR